MKVLGVTVKHPVKSEKPNPEKTRPQPGVPEGEKGGQPKEFAIFALKDVWIKAGKRRSQRLDAKGKDEGRIKPRRGGHRYTWLCPSATRAHGMKGG